MQSTALSAMLYCQEAPCQEASPCVRSSCKASSGAFSCSMTFHDVRAMSRGAARTPQAVGRARCWPSEEKIEKAEGIHLRSRWSAWLHGPEPTWPGPCATMSAGGPAVLVRYHSSTYPHGFRSFLPYVLHQPAEERMASSMCVSGRRSRATRSQVSTWAGIVSA